MVRILVSINGQFEFNYVLDFLSGLHDFFGFYPWKFGPTWLCDIFQLGWHHQGDDHPVNCMWETTIWLTTPCETNDLVGRVMVVIPGGSDVKNQSRLEKKSWFEAVCLGLAYFSDVVFYSPSTCLHRWGQDLQAKTIFPSTVNPRLWKT